MDLFLKFKKDYFNYLISIILPALISGLSIPVFKHLLGSKGYGIFSIWFNAVLIITVILSGWIFQSILRFYPGSPNKYSFCRHALILSFKTQLVFFIPLFLIAYYINKDFLLSLVCCFTLLIISLQFTILPVIQSGFLSKKIILSETIRILSYVVIATLFLKFSGIKYLYSLFFAVIISYSFSFFYLLRQAILFFGRKKTITNNTDNNDLFNSFFKYGAPLSLWFVISYLLSYVDKLFMNKYLGAEIQGNYQAIFDLLSKSITLIISPILTSIYPILTTAYEKGENFKIRRLIKKVIIYELVSFFIISILYWWFGADLLFFILKIPKTDMFKLTGIIVIAGTFIWQIAILIQKRFELKLKSLFLLAMVAIAFSAQIICYSLFSKNNNQLLYPLGFLLSAIIYLFLISFTDVIAYAKSLKSKQKLFL
jgi:O-antigen/teichoic acid export membrane protein